MVQLHDLVAALDAELDAATFADGQHNGLQVAGPEQIQRLATAVSCNLATIEAAAEWGADALLTHHGLLWGGTNQITGALHRRLTTALDAGMALLSYHLPLDAHPTLGNNAALADAAGATQHRAAAFEHGGRPIGLTAAMPAAAPFADWVAGFETALRADCDVATGPFQVWPFGPKRVERIGFASGAAAYDVTTAIELGLDVFVTGETRESVYHECREAGIHFVAGGHYLTERAGSRRVGDWVAKRFGLEHRFIDVQTEA